MVLHIELVKLSLILLKSWKIWILSYSMTVIKWKNSYNTCVISETTRLIFILILRMTTVIKRGNNMTTSTLSTLKIESILRTNCIYPEVFVERMEALYQTNMQRYIAKHKSKFNFMKIGFDTPDTLEKQYKLVFPTWRELNQNLGSKFCYLKRSEVSDFTFYFKTLKCLNNLQQIMRLYQFTENPVQIDYKDLSSIRFFWKHLESIKQVIYD